MSECKRLKIEAQNARLYKLLIGSGCLNRIAKGGMNTAWDVSLLVIVLEQSTLKLLK